MITLASIKKRCLILRAFNLWDSIDYICMSKDNKITELKDKLKAYKNKQQVDNACIGEFRSKLSRRNTQIKDLKAKAIQLAYLTEHLLTVEEYHPDYLEDIKNNMI